MPSSGHINVESLTPFEVLARSVSRIHPLPRNTLRAIAILQLSCIQIGSDTIRVLPHPLCSAHSSHKNLFNTHRLVPAQFNEFYPKCSGPTIPSLHAMLPPEHSR
jgi:hypothetical protein